MEEVGGDFLFISKTTLEVGWSFILWSMLYLEDWSSRSSYFIGVALYMKSLTVYHNSASNLKAQLTVVFQKAKVVYKRMIELFVSVHNEHKLKYIIITH